ncbi:GNAT family N-acetyltransferase [Flindersiella endophytica]
MGIEVRTAREDEREPLHQLSQLAFSARPSAFDEDDDRSNNPLDRRLVATDGDKLVGRFSIWELGQWFGGRKVPMGGVSGVAVDPGYRQRGVGSRLVAAALDAMRERGEVIATLYPMNHTFYRRHGWEVAGSFPEYEVDLRDFADLPKPSSPVVVRPAEEADLPAMRALHDSLACEEPGNLSYGDFFATRRMLGYPGIQEAYVAEHSGRLTGSITFSHKESSGNREFFRLAVGHHVASDLDTELAFARLLAGHYPVARTITFVAPQNRALTMQLSERGTRPHGEGWCWMTRLVDAQGAIAARGYDDSVSAEVRLDLTDPGAAWNTGRWTLAVSDGKGTLEPTTTSAPAVAMGIGQLAALYTGWSNPAQLFRRGLLMGATEADVAALTRIFQGPTPWCQNFF